MAGASVSGTTTWESQILSYKVFIVPNGLLATKKHKNPFEPFAPLCGHSSCRIGHAYIVTDQLTHFLRRDDPLFRFLAAGPALQIRSTVAAAQDFDDRTLQLDGFATQLERMFEQHRGGRDGSERICDSLPGDIRRGTMDGLIQSDLAADARG